MLCWFFCMGSVVMLMMIIKLVFIGWGIGSVEWDFIGIFGYLMFVVVSFLMLVWVFLMNCSEIV